METPIAILLLAVLSVNIIPEVMSSSLAKSFVDNELVPDIIPVPPQDALKISYPSGVVVSEGKELTPTSVKDQPTVTWNADPKSLYTLAMTDPDAPSRENPTRREFLHWLVGNIPGTDINSGSTLVEYVGSGAPQGTKLHRYTFLLYKQPGKIDFSEAFTSKTSLEGRRLFSIAKFALKYSLGNPVAGNFFQAQYDDYVPTVHKQLGI